MESAPKSNNVSKETKQMEKMINEIYNDDLIETAIGVDPEAMYQVLKRMESASKRNNRSKDLKQMGKTINEIYNDDLIETAIGVDPAAMYQIMNRMEVMTEKTERDLGFVAYVDELADGIDMQLNEYLTNLSPSWEHKEKSDLKLVSAVEINSNAIYDLLNRMEARLESTERNLAELRKKKEVVYAAVI